MLQVSLNPFALGHLRKIFAISILFAILLISPSTQISSGENDSGNQDEKKQINKKLDKIKSALKAKYEKLLEKVKQKEKVRVIVGLDMDFDPTKKLKTPQKVLEFLARNSNVQDELLRELAYSDSSYKKFKYTPHMAITVNENALDRLMESPLISSVEEVVLLKLSLTQSIPKIGADDAYDHGFTGDGLAVAILDTGVDSGHSFFEQ